MKTPDPLRSADRSADASLQQALRDLPTDVPAARLEALNQRVFAQWQEAQRLAPAPGHSRWARPWLALWGRGSRASWAAGATGLAVGLALVLNTWLRAPDPALDELLQLDVLSQMAAGEM